MSETESGDQGIDVEAVLQVLEGATRQFPEEALRTVQAHRELFIPRLIQLLDDAIGKIERGQPVDENGHFFAAFLLIEFQAKEALPVFLKLCRLAEDDVFELLGDGVYEVICSALAALSADNLDTIDELIESDQVSMYVSWGAASAYRILVKEGLLTRKEALDRLHQILRRAIEGRHEQAASVTVSELYHFFPREVLDDIRQAYQLNLVDESIVHLEGFENRSEADPEEFENELSECSLTYKYDTVETLRSWYSFASGTESDEDEDEDEFLEDAPKLDAPMIGAPKLPAEPLTPVRFVGERVGRNDPCPCGSGKKFKKCCGGR